jgi:hypothetical protein
VHRTKRTYLSKTCDGVQKTTDQTSTHSSSSGSDERQDLQVLGDEKDRSDAGLQPTTITVADDTAWQVTVTLELLEVLAHVTGNPRLIAGHGCDVVPVLLGRKDSHQGIVLCATTKSSSSGIKNTLSYGTFGRIETRVVLARWSKICHLGVTLSLLLVGIMVNEEVPLDGMVCASVWVQSWHLNLSVSPVVLTCINEQNAVAGKSETSCKGRTTGTRANDDVFVGRIGYRSLSGIVVTIGRKLRIV